MEWYNWIRLVTSILAFFCLWAQVLRGRRLWNDLDRRARDFWWSYNMFLFLLFYGNLEAIVLNVPWGPRSMISLLAILVAVRASLMSFKADRPKGVPKVY